MMPPEKTPDLKAFARDVARELTPSLMALWSRIEVMLAEMRGDGPPSDALGDLEMLHHHAVQMATIVKSLLWFSGDPIFEVRPLDLNTVVTDSLSPLAPRLAGRQVEIEPHLDRTVPPVLADAEALRYVLTTLVETAAETSTAVRVTTERAGKDGARINVGSTRQMQAERENPYRDGLRVVLAEAIVRNLGGTIERQGGNPVVTYAISLRAAG